MSIDQWLPYTTGSAVGSLREPEVQMRDGSVQPDYVF
jgi:hypothetical protein